MLLQKARQFAFIICVFCFIGQGVYSEEEPETENVPIRRHTEKSVDPELAYAMKLPHFESKTVLPVKDEQHKNKCWNKCHNRDSVNVKDALLKRSPETQRMIQVQGGRPSPKKEPKATTVATPVVNNPGVYVDLLWQNELLGSGKFVFFKKDFSNGTV